MHHNILQQKNLWTVSSQNFEIWFHFSGIIFMQLLLGGIIIFIFLLPFGEFVSPILRKWVKMYETKTQLWLIKNTGCLMRRSRKVKFWLFRPLLGIKIVPFTKFTELFIKRSIIRSRNNSFFCKSYLANFLRTPRSNIFNKFKFITFYIP